MRSFDEGNARYSIVKEWHLDAHHCPLYGDNNQCGVAAGETVAGVYLNR